MMICSVHIWEQGATEVNAVHVSLKKEGLTSDMVCEK